MKILNVINVRWYNATAWYAVSLSQALRDAGFETAVGGLPGSPPVKKAQEFGLNVFEADFNSSNPVKVVKTIRRINSFLRDYAPDVVICHRGEFYWYFALLRKFTKKFKLIRVRGDIRPPKSDFVNRFLHRAADMVVASGEFIRARFNEDLRLPMEKTAVVYGGVNAEKFKKSEFGRIKVREEFGFGDDDFVVGIVGRFDPVKGHEILINAVSELHREGMDNIRLMIAGFDAVTSSDDIEQMIKDADAQDICVITGKRDDIVDIMSAMDAAVISSVGSEAICRVGFELMAADIPLITSDTGVLPEIAPVGNVYPRHDKDALKEKLRAHSKDKKIYDLKQFAEEFTTIIKSL